MSWTDERVGLLKKMWEEGMSASHIAAQLGGVSRNAVIGKVHRLKILRPEKVAPSQTEKADLAAKADLAHDETMPDKPATDKAVTGKAATDKTATGRPAAGKVATTDPVNAVFAPQTNDKTRDDKAQEMAQEMATKKSAAAPFSNASINGQAADNAADKAADRAADKDATASSRSDTIAGDDIMAKESDGEGSADGMRAGNMMTDEAEIVPISRRLSLLQLTENTCKWPIGDPLGAGFHFCGAKTCEGSPYCSYHSKIAFQPITERRRVRV